MRTRMVAWSLGLLSVAALAGCQSGYSLRNQPSASPTPEATKAPNPAPSTPAPSPAPAVPPATVAVIIEQDSPPAAPPAPPLPPVRTATVAPPTIAAAPKLPPIVSRNNGEPAKRTPPAPVPTESKAAPAQLATEEVFDIGSEPAPQPKSIPRTTQQAIPPVVTAASSQPLSRGTVEKITPAEVAPPRSVPSTKFNVVTGELQQWRKSWRLRYAPVDVEDEYGGCVILEGIPDGANLRSGQHVRIQGALIPPSNRTDPARYAVRSFALLD